MLTITALSAFQNQDLDAIIPTLEALDPNMGVYYDSSWESLIQQPHTQEDIAAMFAAVSKGFSAELGCLIVVNDHLDVRVLLNMLRTMRETKPNTRLRLYHNTHLPRAQIVPMQYIRGGWG